MNRRGFLAAVGAAVTAPLLPQPSSVIPVTYSGYADTGAPCATSSVVTTYTHTDFKDAWIRVSSSEATISKAYRAHAR